MESFLVSEESEFLRINSSIEGIGFGSNIEEIKVLVSEKLEEIRLSFSSWVEFGEKFRLKRVSMSIFSFSDRLRSKFIFSSTEKLSNER